MESDILPLPYLLAEGPDGLSAVLSTLLEQAQNDEVSTKAGHYILYQLGNQKSLIKVDFSHTPFQFWYCDLLGRPATRIVKETIAKFLWDKCGEKERFYQEFQGS